MSTYIARDEMEDEIILEDGKYRFYKIGPTLCCDRWGERWRGFLGDKAVGALFDECLEAKKKEAE